MKSTADKTISFLCRIMRQGLPNSVKPNKSLPNIIDLDAVPLPWLFGGLGSAHEKYAV